MEYNISLIQLMYWNGLSQPPPPPYLNTNTLDPVYIYAILFSFFSRANEFYWRRHVNENYTRESKPIGSIVHLKKKKRTIISVLRDSFQSPLNKSTRYTSVSHRRPGCLKRSYFQPLFLNNVI